MTTNSENYGRCLSCRWWEGGREPIQPDFNDPETKPDAKPTNPFHHRARCMIDPPRVLAGVVEGDFATAFQTSTAWPETRGKDRCSRWSRFDP
jgi:hypothetical protein